MSTQDRIDIIQARLDVSTKGPWSWFGNSKHHDIYLATVGRGRIFVMGFERWGMQGGQPAFQSVNTGPGVMVKAETLIQYEVDHRKDISGINHPDAELIVHAPDDLEFLLAEVKRLREEVSHGPV